MSRQSTEAALDSLTSAVERHSQGCGIKDLFYLGLPRRTLQRYLSILVSRGRLHTLGQASSRHYLVAQSAAPTLPWMVASNEEWRSLEGMAIEDSIRRPLSLRTPVGYRRTFLDSYKPNRDAYLPTALRDHLHHLGRSPGGERPAGTYARQVLGRLLIDLSWASSRLEGNTYTRLDTQNLIEFGRLAEGKDQLEAQMVLNHKTAIEMLVEDAEAIGFNRYTLQNLHAILADGLLVDPNAGGRLRTIPVSISGTVYEPTAVPQLIAEAFDQLLAKAEIIRDPFEQAFFVMVHLPYLQPFDDVNKRVSRLSANIPLIKHNLAPLSFVDLPVQNYVDAILGVYELNRIELLRDLFVWAYERSCQRYTVLRDAVPQPNPLRLKYRNELSEMIRETVRSAEPIEPSLLRERCRGGVATADLDVVVSMAMNELLGLHEGNIVRFGLRLAEFREWKQGQ